MLQLDLRRNSLLWILGLTFVLGVGTELVQWIVPGDGSLPSVVTQDTRATALRRQADSIMQARMAAAQAPVNINTASAGELESLTGIGPVLARSIVSYREAHGPFASVEDLNAVSGIGPKRLAAIRDRCCVE